MATENIAERLLMRRAPNLSAAHLAEVLDSLVWVMDDNGLEVAAARRKWMEGDDPYAAEVALLMDEGFPYDVPTMILQLGAVARRWPHLSARCETLRQRAEEYQRGY